jgi:hypothetical protein
MQTPIRTREELTAWLDQLSPADRVATCRLLADTHTTGALSALADAAVYEATRHDKAAAVAEQYDLTPRQVQRAVANHNERVRAGKG